MFHDGLPGLRPPPADTKASGRAPKATVRGPTHDVRGRPARDARSQDALASQEDVTADRGRRRAAHARKRELTSTAPRMCAKGTLAHEEPRRTALMDDGLHVLSQEMADTDVGDGDARPGRRRRGLWGLGRLTHLKWRLGRPYVL